MRNRILVFRCNTEKEHKVRYAPTSNVEMDYENMGPDNVTLTSNLTTNNLYDRLVLTTNNLYDRLALVL